MENNELIEKYFEFKRTTNKSRKGIISENTLKLYEMNLSFLIKELKGRSFKEATEQDILNIIKGKKPATKNSRLITYRDFYRWLYKLDEHQPLPKFIRRLKPGKIRCDDIEYREKVISENDYEKLLNYAKDPMQKAILEAFWITGGRRMAVQTIKSDGVWYDGEFTHVILWTSKSIAREVIYENRAEHLLLWSESLQPFKGKKGKPLFVVRKKGIDREEYKQINDQYTYVFLNRLAKRAGINRKMTAHDFRHSRCTKMLKDGVPETHVKTLLGFEKNTAMLRIYDHNKLKDYEEWLEDKKQGSKPTYQLLEKQKKTLEEKHEKEISNLQQEMQKIRTELLEVKMKQVQELQRKKK